MIDGAMSLEELARVSELAFDPLALEREGGRLAAVEALHLVAVAAEQFATALPAPAGPRAAQSDEAAVAMIEAEERFRSVVTTAWAILTRYGAAQCAEGTA